MGQINIGIGGHAIPPQGTRGLGFDTQGRPVYIDAAGVPRLIGTDAAIDNVLASYGVGAEADLPAASAGLVYVTNDTYKIYSGVDTGVYDIRDLTAGQFVTDTYTSVRTTYQYIGAELMPVSGGALDVCSQADVEQAEPTENTKVVTPLRAWQGFMYWCTTSVFADLSTASKTIIGAINELKTNVIKLETNETPAAIADTDSVRFKSATGYFNRTLLAIKNYVKLGLKASEVVNDSTNVTGPTVKAAFDNATLAIDGVTIREGDLFPVAREVEAPAGVFTSVNMYHTWDRIKTEIKTNSGVRFVANETDLNSALQAEVDSMCIVVTEPITSSMSNIYPKNVHISGYDITIPEGMWLLNGTSADAEYNIYFDNTINITKSSSDGTCRIVSVDTKVWNITFRNLESERGVILSQLGGVEGEINITTTRTQDINIATSQGTRTVIIKNTLDNTGFYYRGFSQQGYNQVYSEITDAGNFTVKSHLTFQKSEVGSIILMPSNANVMLHPSKFTITYLSSDLANGGDTGIYGSLDFPRFDGEGEQVTLSINATSKAERYIYIVPDGNGSVEYNRSAERAVMLQNGNWVLNFTGTALGTLQQNRVWYSIVITGHADTTSGNWISI